MDRHITDLPDLSIDPYAVLPSVEALLQHGDLEAAEHAIAPLIDLVARDFWIGRLHARCAGDASWALYRWRAQVDRHPGEPQARADLAHVLRALTGRHDEADAVLTQAALRFPRHLEIQEGLALAAERRGDFAAAAVQWRSLLAFHPTHRPSRPALVNALLRLDRLDAALAAADEVLDADPAFALLRLTLAGLAEAALDWSGAVFQWRAARLADPTLAEGWLGEARMLERFGGLHDSDQVLGQARAVIPESVPVARAWVNVAIRLGDAAETLRRARALHAMAPADPVANRALGEAGMACGDPAAAVAALAVARAGRPDDFDVASLEVTALMELGRWQAALEAAAAMFSRHRRSAEAGRGLVDILMATDRPDQAIAVLRDLRQRFAAERWVLVRLAGLVPPAEASLLWQEAGLPESGSADEVLAYAATLPDAAALAVLAQAALRMEAPPMAVARAEILLKAGDHAGALAIWRDLAPTAAHPSARPEARFLALTAALAAAVTPEDAAPLLATLLDEPDPGHATWRPALGLALAGRTERAGKLRLRVAECLARRPERLDSLATATARNLCAPPPDADTEATRIARAVADGRPGLTALLLGRAPEADAAPARAAMSRTALRLYLNRHFAAPESVTALDAVRLALLFQLARAFDPDCLGYLADIARPRYQPAAIPDLPTSAHVVGAIAHAVSVAAAPGRVEGLLRIALCLHGRLDERDDRAGIAAALGLAEHDVTVFAHLWPSGAGAGATDAALLERLPDGVHDAIIRAGLEPAIARARYPALFSTAHRRFTARQSDAAGDLPHCVIEDPADIGGRSRGEGWNARMKACHAHRMALASARQFDLVIHLRADRPATLLQPGRPVPDWGAMAHAARTSQVVFADEGYYLDPIEGLSVGAVLMIGGMTAMTIAADSFALAEMIGSGRADVAGFSPEQTEHGTLGQMLHLSGCEVTALPVAPRTLLDRALPPLSRGEALARLWQDMRARPPYPSDARLLQAALADILSPPAHPS